MVILFLTQLSNPSTDIFEVIITENSDLKKLSPTEQATNAYISTYIVGYTLH
jgi:hypothetical protein